MDSQVEYVNIEFSRRGHLVLWHILVSRHINSHFFLIYLDQATKYYRIGLYICLILLTFVSNLSKVISSEKYKMPIAHKWQVKPTHYHIR